MTLGRVGVVAAAEVVVVGAGVIGLTTAVTLAEHGHRVTVVAEEIPGRTSLAAGASWGPYDVAPRDRVDAWATTTLGVLVELTRVPDAAVAMVSGVEASRTATTMPDWAGQLPDVAECPPEDLPKGFRTGWRYTVPVVDMPRYLDYLLDRLHAADGRVERRRLGRLAEVIDGGRSVVNCAGIDAGDLAGDPTVYPIRGQLVVVENPGIDTFFSEDTGPSPNLLHYLPRGDTVILGGVAVPEDRNREPDLATSAAILARCSAVEPSLKGARILDHRVGLRPTRQRIRVEAERSGAAIVVHNYGHGGAGVSLSWGCAMEVCSLLRA